MAQHLESVEALKRPADLTYSAMDSSQIELKLGWASKVSIEEIVDKMSRDELF